ncbi:MAG: hypothetical protein AAF430_14220 [Myxococcota bacterium]
MRFHEDRRGVWRATWTLSLGLLGVACLMRETGAGSWPLFGGLGALLVGLGATALRGPAKPLLDLLPEGLRLYAGSVGLGGIGASDHLLAWSAIRGVAFEERRIERKPNSEDPMWVTVLAFAIDPAVESPDGGRGFVEKLVGRRDRWAVGEHFLWNPMTRKLDLTTPPRGGWRALTAAIAAQGPALSDASADRRQGIDGPLAYVVFDVALAVAVLALGGSLLAGETAWLAAVAQGALALAGQITLPLP